MEEGFCILQTLSFRHIHSVDEYIHFSNISNGCFCNYNSGGSLENYFWEINFEFKNWRNNWKICNFNENFEFRYHSMHYSSLEKYSVMLKNLQHLVSS